MVKYHSGVPNVDAIINPLDPGECVVSLQYLEEYIKKSLKT